MTRRTGVIQESFSLTQHLTDTIKMTYSLSTFLKCAAYLAVAIYLVWAIAPGGFVSFAIFSVILAFYSIPYLVDLLNSADDRESGSKQPDESE